MLRYKYLFLLKLYYVVGMLTREIYEKGQVVIPKFIREMFGFEAGTKVSFSVEEDKVIIKKHHSVADEFEKMATGKVGKLDLDAEHDSEISDRMKRLGINVHRR